MRIFLTINQSFSDGTAHSLYFLRHSWWLAKTRPQSEIVMIHTVPRGEHGPSIGPRALEAAGLPALPNLRFVSFPVFDLKIGVGRMRISRFFYRQVALFLKKEVRKGDVFFTASFPALFTYIRSKRYLREKMFMAYEVHALRELDDLLDRRMIRRERAALRAADWLPCTTESLEEIVLRIAPGHSTYVSGFGCGFDPALFDNHPAETLPETAVIGYIGSLYPIQGIVWLSENWKKVRQICGPLTLRIFGGNAHDLQYLEDRAGEGVEIVGPVPSVSVPEVTCGLDAMVIPSLNSGRMPLVVITKAYDYTAIGLPILAARIPSIQEVLEENTAALLFTPGDVESLSAAILRLKEPGHGRRLANNAKESSLRLSWADRNERFWNALEKKVSE